MLIFLGNSFIWIIKTINNNSKVKIESKLTKSHIKNVQSSSNKYCMEGFHLRKHFNKLNYILLPKLKKTDQAVPKNSFLYVFEFLQNINIKIKNEQSVGFFLDTQGYSEILENNFSMDNKIIDFRNEEDIILKALDLNESHKISSNYLSSKQNTFEKEFNEKITKYKNIFWSDFLNIKGLAQNETNDISSTYKLYLSYKNKYNKIINRFIKKKYIDEIKFILSENIIKNANCYILLSYTYTIKKLYLNFIFSKLKMLVNFSESVIYFNEFIKNKSLEQSITDQNVIVEQEKIIQKAQKLIDEKQIKYQAYNLQIREKESCLTQYNANLFEVYIQYIRKNLNDSNKLNTDKIEKHLIKTYHNINKINRKTSNEITTMYDNLWSVTIKEITCAKQRYFIEFYYLQYIQNKINPINFFQIFLYENIGLYMNEIDYRIKVWQEILTRKILIYLKDQYSYFKKILEDRKLINMLLENELSAIKVLKCDEVLSNIEKLNQLFAKQEKLKEAQFNNACNIAIDEIKLKKTANEINELNYHFFLEFQLKKVYLMTMNMLCDSNNKSIADKNLRLHTFINVLIHKHRDIEAIFCQFLAYCRLLRTFLKEKHVKIEQCRVINLLHTVKSLLKEVCNDQTNIKKALIKLYKKANYQLNILTEQIIKINNEVIISYLNIKIYRKILIAHKRNYISAFIESENTNENLVILLKQLQLKFYLLNNDLDSLDECFQNYEINQEIFFKDLESIGYLEMKIEKLLLKANLIREECNRNLNTSDKPIDGSYKIKKLENIEKNSYNIISMIYLKLDILFNNSIIYEKGIELELGINKLNELNLEINELENEIKKIQSPNRFFLDYCSLIPKKEEMIKKFSYLLSLVINAYLHYFYHSYQLEKCMIIIFEIKKAIAKHLKILKYIREHVQINFKTTKFVNQKELIKAQKYYDDLISFLFKFSGSIRRQQFNIQKAKKLFKNSNNNLETHLFDLQAKKEDKVKQFMTEKTCTITKNNMQNKRKQKFYNYYFIISSILILSLTILLIVWLFKT
ncbi:hypothetical protein NUSPORA_01765 [Nucleospora cyclopteri]